MWLHTVKKTFSNSIRADTVGFMQHNAENPRRCDCATFGGEKNLSKSHFKIGFEMGWLLNCCNRGFSGSRVAERR